MRGNSHLHSCVYIIKEQRYNNGMKELILSLENGEINLDQFVEMMAALTVPTPEAQ